MTQQELKTLYKLTEKYKNEQWKLSNDVEKRKKDDGDVAYIILLRMAYRDGVALEKHIERTAKEMGINLEK